MAEAAMEESDDDFERLSDFSDLTLSDADSDAESDNLDAPQNRPATSPPSNSSHQELPRHKQKRFVCTHGICLKAFNRPALLEQHLRSHTNDRAFECQYEGCSKTYLRESHLKHHVKSVHTKIRDYKCTWEGCDKSFMTGTRLKNHLARHEGHERFRCRGFGDCNQTFRKKDTLQRHVIAVHLGAKPFPCPQPDCNKAFLTAEHLRQHQRVNHNPRRYSCDVCLEAIETDELLSDLGKRQKRQVVYFGNWTDFQIHKEEFHPPTCEHCNQAFQTNKQLTKHLEVEHEDQDPNNMSAPPILFCHDCHKTYPSERSFKAHAITHRAKVDMPYPCIGNMRLYEAGPGKLKFLPGQDQAPEGAAVYDVVGCENIDYSYNHPYQLASHIHGPQHLGLNKKKKRDAKEAELAVDGGKEEKKARKARKDKGVIKKRLGSGVVGIGEGAEEDGPAAGVGDGTVDTFGHFDDNDPDVLTDSTTSFPVQYGWDYHDFIDDITSLTGSETIVEGEVFDAGGRGRNVTPTSYYPPLD